MFPKTGVMFPCSLVPLFPTIFSLCSLVPQNPWETLSCNTKHNQGLISFCTFSWFPFIALVLLTSRQDKNNNNWLCSRWILSFHLGFQPTDNAEDKDGCKSTSSLDYQESYRRLDCYMKGEEEGSRISKERSFQYHLSWSAFWSTQWLVLYQPSTRLPKKACWAGTFWRLRKRIKSHVWKAMNERMALYRLSVFNLFFLDI